MRPHPPPMPRTLRTPHTPRTPRRPAPLCSSPTSDSLSPSTSLKKYLAAARGSRAFACSTVRAAVAAQLARWPSWISLVRRTLPRLWHACREPCFSAQREPSISNMRDIRWHTTAGFSHMKEPKAEKRANSISSFVALGT